MLTKRIIQTPSHVRVTVRYDPDDVHHQLVKNLLPPIILRLLATKPMHGYELIVLIRQKYCVYLGPSVIYPLLCGLERSGYLASQWQMEPRPKKIYTITQAGQNLLRFTAEYINLLAGKLNSTQ